MLYPSSTESILCPCPLSSPGPLGASEGSGTTLHSAHPIPLLKLPFRAWLNPVLCPGHPLCPSGEGARAPGRKRPARVVTHWDPDCDSPEFFGTQKVNRRPGFPTSCRSPSPSSQPDGPTGWGEGRREKRADCAKENTRDRDGKRQEIGRDWERPGEGRLSDSLTEKSGRGRDPAWGPGSTWGGRTA